MKTTFAIPLLIAALSGLPVAHGAGFNDRGSTINPIPARASQPGSSQMPVIHGFKQQSHQANAALKAGASVNRAITTVSAQCDLPPRIGFNDSSSPANC